MPERKIINYPGAVHFVTFSTYQRRKFLSPERHDLCPEDCAIWQARFYDYLVESDEKLLEKIQYMHDNPVTAGLVTVFPDWKWSSARFYELNENVGVTINPIR